MFDFIQKYRYGPRDVATTLEEEVAVTVPMAGSLVDYNPQGDLKSKEATDLHLAGK